MSLLATLHTVSLRAPREAVSLPSSPGPPPPTPPQKKTRASLPSQAEAIGIRARAEPTDEQRKDQWELPGLHLCWHPAQFLSRTEGPEAKGLLPTPSARVLLFLNVPTLQTFSVGSVHNVDQAVCAVAHGLHQLLGCASQSCSRGRVYPWQARLSCNWHAVPGCFPKLLERILKVNFHLHKDTVTFNDSVDPLSSYNIIAWDWTFRVIGSSTWSPVQPDINKTKIQWHDKDNQVPESVCSSDCLEGHQRMSVCGFPPPLL